MRENLQGLRWEKGGAAEGPQGLQGLLAQAPATSVVLAFMPWKIEGATYDELKLAGLHRTPTGVSDVFILLGNTYGFDSEDEVDKSFFEGVLAKFAEKFGQHKVARVPLCQRDDPLEKFPTASLAAFLSIEYARGMVDHAVAGLQVCQASWVRPSPCADQVELPGAKTYEVGETGKDACKREMWFLLGTWWDTKGSKYEITGDDAKDCLKVRISRTGRDTLNKTISLGKVNGRSEVVWDGGAYVMVSEQLKNSPERPETVEWKAIGRNRTFTWHITPPSSGAPKGQKRYKKVQQ
uniref:Uncharacterized protein n=1 Tax=Pyrodinium bahamense TaxID=73915 RepID=A0A7S0AE94_9DINO|mmetsp:Transcript_32039/g.88256  ORF Transcript_32039/g.88256 Transcript_32039/m.88256 type:complete len:294 (+) Transcript_32039:3-884(+)